MALSTDYKYLLSFGPESFNFRFAIQKHKDRDIQNYNFAVVTYGCEACCLTMGEEHRLTAPENKVLKKKLGSKRDEVTREWRRLHKEELYDLYSSTNIRMSKSE